jgi:hypothetical protein
MMKRITYPRTEPGLSAPNVKISRGTAATNGSICEISARFECMATYESFEAIQTMIGKMKGAKKMLKYDKADNSWRIAKTPLRRFAVIILPRQTADDSFLKISL